MTDFQFASPHYLYLLCLLPLLIGLWLLHTHRRRKALLRLAEHTALRRLVSGMSPIRLHVKAAMVIGSMAFLIIALARPQYGQRTEVDTTDGIEVALMVDVSNSMLAEDTGDSRLNKTRMFLSDLTSRLTGSKIALGVFAGEAYPIMPMTGDLAMASTFIENIHTDMVTLQGTNLAAAISLGMKNFSTDNEVGKALILITDGEDHTEGAKEAARNASQKGIKVIVVGVGSTEGAPIPLPGGGMLTDEGGAPVHTALNEQMAKEVAEAAGGFYLHLESMGAAGERLTSELSTLKRKSTSTSFSKANEQFQAFTLIGFLLILLEGCLFTTKYALGRRLKLFFTGRTFINRQHLLILLIAGLSVQAQPTMAQNKEYREIHKGNTRFGQGDFDRAGEHYMKALRTNPRHTRALFNMADVFLAKGDAHAADSLYEQVTRYETNRYVKSCAYHGRGYIRQQQALHDGQQKTNLLKEAIEQYKQALRLWPQADETRYNLALCQKQLKDQSQNQQQQKKQQQKQQKQQQQLQQQQQPQPQDQQKQQPNKQTEAYQNLVKQAEKRTLEKLKQAKPYKRSLDKNW